MLLDSSVNCRPAIAIGNLDPENPLATGSVTIARNSLKTITIGISIADTRRADVIGNTVENLQGACPDYTGVGFYEVDSGSTVRNTLINASPLYVLDPPSSVVVCGNRSTSSGPYDEPEPC